MLIWGTSCKTLHDDGILISNKNANLLGPAKKKPTVHSGKIKITPPFLRKKPKQFTLPNTQKIIPHDQLHPRKFKIAPLKNDGWKMILSFWDGLFSGAFSVKLPPREHFTPPPPRKTNMVGRKINHLKIYSQLKMGIFQPAM